MLNKRKNDRLGCAVPVEGKQGSPFDQVRTVNISKGGLGFISNRRIPLNKEVAIELNLKENEDAVFVLGKVRWVKAVANSALFRIGLSFEDIVNGSRGQLNQYFSAACK